MTQDGHLKTFDLTLVTKTPIFIGYGKSYTKKEYLFDPQSSTVSFLDEHTMFTYLAEHHLADAYEQYMLDHMGRDLQDFLLNICKISRSQLQQWIKCRVNAGDALDDNHTLKEIQRFMRNGYDQIYIPGSSVKGALRTTLLTAALLKSPPQEPNPDLPVDRYASFEDAYFHTLSLKRDRNQMVQTGNPLNSIMQGVRISDSLPVPDSRLCLTRKIDEFPDRTYNAINICRECIKPGTQIRCVLTLDQSILRGEITEQTIVRSIAEASAFYQRSVIAHYPQACNDMNSKTILLGGGVGYQSKTVTNAYYGNQAMDVTMRVLDAAFRKHRHLQDWQEGISPRALKQTDFNNTPYAYGVCEVSIQ